MNWKG